MNRKGFTLVEIMIVVAIIALLAAIAVPNLLQARKTANEAAAKATVRSLSTAAEVFATSHAGAYPISVVELTTFIASAPAYCNVVSPGVQGYIYTCDFVAGGGGYTIVATPTNPGTTGTAVYTGSTGGVLTPLN